MPPPKKRPLKKADVVKSLKGFVMDEDGFVSKETILKVGLATVAGMAALGAATNAGAADHASHTNNVGVPQNEASGNCCYQHTNTVTHASY
ncbi:MAG: hypothetical protein HQL22_07495 [Candidatus Omnitrophica bacterium]|nr:hypothetical protein [Candidatus Omnitrophota bacterium]